MDWVGNEQYPWTEYAFFGYDATWAIALMLNKSQERLKQKMFEDGEKRGLEDFTYRDLEMSQIFFDAMAETNFKGMSVSQKYR